MAMVCLNLLLNLLAVFEWISERDGVFSDPSHDGRLSASNLGLICLAISSYNETKKAIREKFIHSCKDERKMEGEAYVRYCEYHMLYLLEEKDWGEAFDL